MTADTLLSELRWLKEPSTKNCPKPRWSKKLSVLEGWLVQPPVEENDIEEIDERFSNDAELPKDESLNENFKTENPTADTILMCTKIIEWLENNDVKEFTWLIPDYKGNLVLQQAREEQDIFVIEVTKNLEILFYRERDGEVTQAQVVLI